MNAGRYMLKIAYDGSGFCGWQEQLPPDGEAVRTVQGDVRAAMQRVLGREIRLQGASRTDTGVHALGQVAHFEVGEGVRIPEERLAMAINSRLADDVEVLRVQRVRGDFDATGDAVEKQYRYRLWMEGRRPLQHRSFVYPVRYGGLEYQIVIRGGGFLYRMVRIVAGTLVEVGRGHFEPRKIDELLAVADRAQAGPTLPPMGLCLEWIRYPEEKLVVDGGGGEKDIPVIKTQ